MATVAPAMKEAPLTIGEADIYDEKVDRFIDQATLKALSKIKPWRGLLQIALEWLGIAAAIVLKLFRVHHDDDLPSRLAASIE